MRIEIRMGAETIVVEVPQSATLGRSRFAATACKGDAVQAALAEPTGSPPLRSALTPDDHVTILLDPRLPHPEVVLAPIFDELAAAEVTADTVTILSLPCAGQEARQAALAARFPGCRLAVHDPTATDSLAYLASTGDGRRLYFHRAVVDADFVLPVAAVGPDTVAGYRSPWSLLFPLGADEPGLERARAFAMETAGDAAVLAGKQGSAEAAWLAGLLMGVGVGLTGEGAVARAWFGMLADVDDAAKTWSAEQTRTTGAKSAPELAVVGFSTPAGPSTWDDVALGLSVALKFAPAGTPLLALTDLSEPPPEAVRWLAESDDYSARRGRFRTSAARKSEDAPAAAALAAVLSSSKVYLHSRLEPEQVESLGFVAVPSPSEAATLVKRAASVLIVEDANRLWVV